MPTFITRMKRPRYFMVLLAAVFAVAFVMGSRNGANGNGELVRVEQKDVIQIVRATGRVQPSESVELAFEQTGRVQFVGPKVGDAIVQGQLLVQLNQSAVAAELGEAEASVQVAFVKLDELKRGTRVEELKVQEAKVADARQDLTDALEDAYTRSDDAIRNKVNQFFRDAHTADPKLLLDIHDQTLKNRIEQERIMIQQTLFDLEERVAGASGALDAVAEASGVQAMLERIRSFLNDCALAVNRAIPSPPFAQSDIDTHRANVSEARTSVNTALGNVSAASAAFTIEMNELRLLESGATAEALRGQEATLAQAKANTDQIRARLARYSLRSPIRGVLTKQEAKVGEIVSAGAITAAVISDTRFEIEANVSETDIVRLAVATPATVTMDAYGDDAKFLATVVSIDPAETVIDGITTYKTVFQFSEYDSRIRSGMTANIEVIAASRNEVLAIPERALVARGGKKFVRVQGIEGMNEVEVELGLRGSDGTVEIVSGLREGDKVKIDSR